LVVVLGIEFQTLCFLGRLSTAWARRAAFFFRLFLRQGLAFCLTLAWTSILLSLLPAYLGLQARTTPPDYWLRWKLTFFQCWPPIMILSISASEQLGLQTAHTNLLLTKHFPASQLPVN
jgi:hypothetical protein